MALDLYKGAIPILDPDLDGKNADVTDMLHPVGAVYGCEQRDLSAYPLGSKLSLITDDGVFEVDGNSLKTVNPFNEDGTPRVMKESPSAMVLIPESEWEARYREQEEMQSSLEHMFLSGPGGTPIFENLDQNGNGYCWFYSNTHGLMFIRMVMGQPLVILNAHSGAAIIKKGADQGGWCGLGAEFIRQVGVAPMTHWKLHSRDISQDTPAVRAEMAKYRITEDWVDVAQPVYSQNLTEKMLATCNFLNMPCPTDYNWWSHSVLRIRKVLLEAGSWGVLILNSWKGWGRHGLGVLRGSQATANGAIAYRQARAA